MRNVRTIEDDLDSDGLFDVENEEETDSDRVANELDRMIDFAGSNGRKVEKVNWSTDLISPPLNWLLVGRFCTVHTPIEEVASFFNLKVADLKRRCFEENGMHYADFENKFTATGKIALRSKQFETAMKGSTSMLSFLGKNVLKQSDVTQNTEDQSNMNVSLSQLYDILLEKKKEDSAQLPDSNNDYILRAYTQAKANKEMEKNGE